MLKPRIKYTITMQEGDKAVTAYIEVKRPLTGDEPLVRERFGALLDLMDSADDDYMDIFKGVVFDNSRKELVNATTDSQQSAN